MYIRIQRLTVFLEPCLLLWAFSPYFLNARLKLEVSVVNLKFRLIWFRSLQKVSLRILIVDYLSGLLTWERLYLARIQVADLEPIEPLFLDT